MLLLSSHNFTRKRNWCLGHMGHLPESPVESPCFRKFYRRCRRRERIYLEGPFDLPSLNGSPLSHRALTPYIPDVFTEYLWKPDRTPCNGGASHRPGSRRRSHSLLGSSRAKTMEGLILQEPLIRPTPHIHTILQPKGSEPEDELQVLA